MQKETGVNIPEERAGSSRSRSGSPPRAQSPSEPSSSLQGAGMSAPASPVVSECETHQVHLFESVMEREHEAGSAGMVLTHD